MTKREEELYCHYLDVTQRLNEELKRQNKHLRDLQHTTSLLPTTLRLERALAAAEMAQCRVMIETLGRILEG